MLKRAYNKLKSFLGFSKQQSITNTRSFGTPKVNLDLPEPRERGGNHIARNHVKKKRKRRKIVNASRRANR